MTHPHLPRIFEDHESTRILVVDDDPGQLALQAEILKQIPHCLIMTAKRGEEALSLIREQPLDLLLLDKRLPDLSGDEICRTVRQEYNNQLLPIIMVTGLDEHELAALKKGAVLHDIGKIGIPDAILLKPDSLSEEEWQVMRRHSEIGANLCMQLNSIRDAVPIIRHHHERWDGSGYPDGLAGEAIPRVARVFQCADIYDALRYKRAYSGPLSVDEIIVIFQEELDRGWRDPVIGELFSRCCATIPNSSRESESPLTRMALT